MAEMAVNQPAPSTAGSGNVGRPTRALPTLHLLNISV